MDTYDDDDREAAALLLQEGLKETLDACPEGVGWKAKTGVVKISKQDNYRGLPLKVTRRSDRNVRSVKEAFSEHPEARSAESRERSRTPREHRPAPVVSKPVVPGKKKTIFAPWPEAIDSEKSASQKASEKRLCRPWPVKGLRVRLVDSGGTYKNYHLLKGVVKSVNVKTGDCEVELVNGKILLAISENCLETVVSKDCVRVEIVRGPYYGSSAQLVKRDKARNLAVVRPNNGKDIEVAMDDICELA
eukprot:TRINITY_DN10864_c0_g4_i5.p1 TRINITY_DN10864_c0_g4~~TRINITY_DN10864_c0_g4_i5.p1  ORF type:complete len:263 (+),score=54.79 TRINITY_DN10864_c0_g4_i5:51-791(+)